MTPHYKLLVSHCFALPFSVPRLDHCPAGESYRPRNLPHFVVATKCSCVDGYNLACGYSKKAESFKSTGLELQR